MTHVDNERLTSFISRIERLEEEKKNISEDIKEVYNEAKSSGFETKALRKVVKLKKISESNREKQKHEEIESYVETYKNALGLD